jgi:hypothetical protein
MHRALVFRNCYSTEEPPVLVLALIFEIVVLMISLRGINNAKLDKVNAFAFLISRLYC